MIFQPLSRHDLDNQQYFRSISNIIGVLPFVVVVNPMFPLCSLCVPLLTET